MATRDRPAYVGRERGRDLTRTLGRELRGARRGLGLSLRDVGRAAGLSASEVSRIERGLIANVSVLDLSILFAVVGLDLAARAYPGPRPIRDAGHAALLLRFRARLHPSLVWRTEVPLPRAGDPRAWDAAIVGPARQWRFGIEAETRPTDGQALARRLMLKERDGAMDGVLLLLPDTRHTRAFRREFAILLSADLPVAGPEALRRLARGDHPGGSALIVC